MKPEPKNILIIHFGQIGDVILSLPAIEALRKRYSSSNLTLGVGKSARVIVEMSDLADEIIAVDRVELRDGNPLLSVGKILKLVKQIRAKKFDFVVDLHSLPETNILGYLSGAKLRLFVDRNNRSLNFLSNFRPSPPEYFEDAHISEFYSRSLEPLGIRNVKQTFQIESKKKDLESVSRIFRERGIENRILVGLHFGAGAPSRRSSLDSFGKLAKMLEDTGNYSVVVFAGPEEADKRDEFFECFPSNVPLLDNLTLRELAAAFSQMKVVVGNDSGPIHLAGAVGVPVVLVSGNTGPTNFTPLARELRVVTHPNIYNADVERLFEAVESLIS